MMRAGSAPMPEDAATPLREDLEVEVSEVAHPERIARVLEGLLDGLAGELLVLLHRRLPRRLRRLAGLMVPCCALGGGARGPVVLVDPAEPGGGGLGSGIVTGNRGVWSTAKPGVHPNSGKSPP